jgi:kynurenine formamidase
VFSIDRVVDLSRPIQEDMAVWPGMPAPSFDVMLNHEEHGIFVRKLHITEHDGTHIDAPAHFIKGGTTVEALAIDKLVCPAVVIDVSDRCEGRPDYAVAVADVERFESAHGRVPASSAALFRTGWDAFWDDHERFVGVVGELHFPGIGEDAARLLVEQRDVVGIGIDTLGIEPGSVGDLFPVHRDVTLPRGVWHLEGLVNLGQVPPVGAWLVVGSLPLVGGSGAPARVFALVG